MTDPMTPEDEQRIEELLAMPAALLQPEAIELRSEVKRLRREVAEREWSDMLTHQACQNRKHADWWVDSEHNHLCPWCLIEQARDERDAIARNYAALQAEAIRLEGERDEARNALAEARKGKVEQMLDHLDDWGVDLAHVVAERDAARKELAAVRDELDQAVRRAAHHEDRAENLSRQLRAARAELQQAETEADVSDAAAAAWRTACDRAAAERDQARAELADANELAAGLRAEVERLRAELEQAQATITRLTRKLQVEEIHYRHAQRARRKAEASRDRARAVAAEADRDSARGALAAAERAEQRWDDHRRRADRLAGQVRVLAGLIRRTGAEVRCSGHPDHPDPGCETCSDAEIVRAALDGTEADHG